MNSISVVNLTKQFNHQTVVKSLSFTIDHGDIIGFLGPNGAGKSTTINMITGLLPPDSGTIYLDNTNILKSPSVMQRALGLVPQDISIFEDITAFENVKFFTSLYAYPSKTLVRKANKALSLVGLTESANDYPKNFSGGMKRRLNIACAISHEPTFLIMDEPTVGIDPQSRNYIIQTIKHLNATGTTILYVSHYMEEIQSLCNKIILLDHGTKIFEGELAQLLLEHQNNSLEDIFLELTGTALRDEV